MIQHLPTAVHHAYREKDQIHPARNEENSFLYELYGSDMLVNSAHHQGVGIPGRGIRYIQYAPDGVVEGLQHEFLPVYGVQWHPERLERDISMKGWKSCCKAHNIMEAWLNCKKGL